MNEQKEPIVKSPVSGNPYLILKRPDGTVVNLSFVDPLEPVQDVYPSEERTRLLVFRSIGEAESAKANLARSYPEFADEINSLEATWLSRSFIDSGYFDLEDLRW